MITRDECYLLKNKFKDNDNVNQYSNLNLNQIYKSQILINVQTYSKSNNDKYCVTISVAFPDFFTWETLQEYKICIWWAAATLAIPDSTTTDNYKEKEKSQLWNKSPNLHLNTSKLNDEMKKESKQQWKNENTLKTTNKSTLSLHIAAYENSNEAAASDSFFDSQVEKRVNTKQIITDASSFISQNQFEFPRQQSNQKKPEVSQFKASQRLRNPNKVSKSDQTKSSTESTTKTALPTNETEEQPISVIQAATHVSVSTPSNQQENLDAVANSSKKPKKKIPAEKQHDRYKIRTSRREQRIQKNPKPVEEDVPVENKLVEIKELIKNYINWRSGKQRKLVQFLLTTNYKDSANPVFSLIQDLEISSSRLTNEEMAELLQEFGGKQIQAQDGQKVNVEKSHDSIGTGAKRQTCDSVIEDDNISTAIGKTDNVSTAIGKTDKQKSDNVSTAIGKTDNVSTAIGKIDKQKSDNVSTAIGKTDNVSTAIGKTDKQKSDNVSTAIGKTDKQKSDNVSTAIGKTDNVSTAIGKTDKQKSDNVSTAIGKTDNVSTAIGKTDKQKSDNVSTAIGKTDNVSTAIGKTDNVSTAIGKTDKQKSDNVSTAIGKTDKQKSDNVSTAIGKTDKQKSDNVSTAIGKTDEQKSEKSEKNDTTAIQKTDEQKSEKKYFTNVTQTSHDGTMVDVTDIPSEPSTNDHYQTTSGSFINSSMIEILEHERVAVSWAADTEAAMQKILSEHDHLFSLMEKCIKFHHKRQSLYDYLRIFKQNLTIPQDKYYLVFSDQLKKILLNGEFDIQLDKSNDILTFDANIQYFAIQIQNQLNNFRENTLLLNKALDMFVIQVPLSIDENINLDVALPRSFDDNDLFLLRENGNLFQMYDQYSTQLKIAFILSSEINRKRALLFRQLTKYEKFVTSMDEDSKRIYSFMKQNFISIKIYPVTDPEFKYIDSEEVNRESLIQMSFDIDRLKEESDKLLTFFSNIMNEEREETILKGINANFDMPKAEDFTGDL